ncbi:Endoribonuclease Dicer, partial [Cichlidogyrus casuarinus]
SESEEIGFGLLSSKPLKNIPAFPVFSRSGEERVTIVEIWSPEVSVEKEGCVPIRTNYELTEDDRAKLEQFHRILFKSVLRLEKEAVLIYDFELAYNSLLVVPINVTELAICWPLVDETIASYDCKMNVCIKPPRFNIQHVSSPGKTPCQAAAKLLGQFDFRDCDFDNSIVMPTYRNLDQVHYYIVAEIRRDLSPMSPFPSQ